MWDRPDLLNSTASLVFALAGLAALYGIIVFVVQLPVHPIRRVVLMSAPVHIDRSEIETLVRRDLRGNFFTLDLGHARESFEALPWARRVDLRRRWPDTLEVRIEEHRALARWGAGGLVNVQGEVFPASLDAPLPSFEGPAGSAAEIAIQYDWFSRRLEAVGRTPAKVGMSERRSWTVVLDDGVTLRLGREKVEQRLERFVNWRERAAAALKQPIAQVDLRYPAGFAVRAADPAGDGAEERGR